MFLQVGFCDVDDFRGDALSLEVLDAVDVRRLGRGQHPPQGLPGILGVDQFRHLHHVRPGLRDPVLARQSRVEHPVLDVAADLLGPDQHDLQFFVVHPGGIGPAADRAMETRLAHELKGGFLQASFRQRQFD